MTKSHNIQFLKIIEFVSDLYLVKAILYVYTANKA